MSRFFNRLPGIPRTPPGRERQGDKNRLLARFLSGRGVKGTPGGRTRSAAGTASTERVRTWAKPNP